MHDIATFMSAGGDNHVSFEIINLPPLRDAERALRSGRGSRLSRLIANLSEEKLKEIRDRSELMPLEEDFNDFNSAVSQEEEIIHAKNLINESLEKAAGTVY